MASDFVGALEVVEVWALPGRDDRVSCWKWGAWRVHQVEVYLLPSEIACEEYVSFLVFLRFFFSPYCWIHQVRWEERDVALRWGEHGVHGTVCSNCSLEKRKRIGELQTVQGRMGQAWKLDDLKKTVTDGWNGMNIEPRALTAHFRPLASIRGREKNSPWKTFARGWRRSTHSPLFLKAGGTRIPWKPSSRSQRSDPGGHSLVLPKPLSTSPEPSARSQDYRMVWVWRATDHGSRSRLWRWILCSVDLPTLEYLGSMTKNHHVQKLECPANFTDTERCECIGTDNVWYPMAHCWQFGLVFRRP